MTTSDKEILFMFSYISFLLFFLFFSTNMFNAEGISGITQDQIEILNDPIELSSDPLIFFPEIIKLFNKFGILFTVSSEIQLLSLILLPLTIIALYIIAIRIREFFKI